MSRSRDPVRGAALVSLRSGLLVLAALLCWGASGCAPRDAQVSLPEGAWLFGSAAELRPLLSDLQRLEQTPTARRARMLAARLDGCEDFLAHRLHGSFALLLDSIECVDDSGRPEELANLRGDADLAFVLATGPQSRLIGTLERDASGSVRIDARFDAASDRQPGIGALLIPGDEPAGAPVLDTRDSVVHARLRPASGLDLAALIPEDSQADRMFKLRSELFVGAVLDGAWEAAIYLPVPDRVTPPMVLALDHSLRAAAQKGAEEFVASLESTWPIHHTVTRFGPDLGACFFDMPILPDLAPCYVVNERSIVVGWNPISLEIALGLVESSPAPVSIADGLGREGGVLVHLDRLSEADRRLREQFGQAPSDAHGLTLWDRLSIRGRPLRGGLDLRVELIRVVEGAVSG